jgi:hypothetical protein
MRRASRRSAGQDVLQELAPSGPGQTEETDNGDMQMVTPLRKRTQQDQDKADEQARTKAMKDLVSSWQDRLQLITLITTFLASVEASMLQVTMPSGDDDPNSSSKWSQAANAGFMGSLVLHLWASFVSFFASFFLVRFKVQEAKREEKKVEAADHSMRHVPTSKGDAILDMAAHHITHSPTHSPTDSPPNSTLRSRHTSHEKDRTNSSPAPSAAIWSANPQLVQIGPFQRQPPVNLLSRCHTLCLLATAVGFILAMVGVFCYGWALQSTSVAIVTSACIGICLLSCLFIGIPQSSNRVIRFLSRVVLVGNDTA